MMEPSTVPSGKDTNRYPYPSFVCIEKTSYHIESTPDDSPRHMVFGHSQIRNMWNADLKKDLIFPIDWFSYSGGKARFLSREIIKTLKANSCPLRISAIIWQNSITDTSLEDLLQISNDIQAELIKHPQHKVAFPTVLFVPDQEKFWDKVAKLNEHLGSLNLKNGLNLYSLHKSIMNKKKGKGLRVVQSAWKEFNNNSGKGYHIDEKHAHQYANFIRNYHIHGFLDQKAGRRSQPPAERKGHNAPSQTMKMPQEVDGRDLLNNIKSRKRTMYGKVVMQDELNNLEQLKAEKVELSKNQIMETDEIIEEQKEKRIKLKEMDQRLTAKYAESQKREEALNMKEKELDEKEKRIQKIENECEKREQAAAEAMAKHEQVIRELKTKEIMLMIDIQRKNLELEALCKEKKKKRKHKKKERKYEEKNNKDGEKAHEKTS